MNPIPKNPETDETLFEDTSTVSSTECTGLEAIPPEGPAEVGSLEEIYDLPLTGRKPKTKEK